MNRGKSVQGGYWTNFKKSDLNLKLHASVIQFHHEECTIYHANH